MKAKVVQPRMHMVGLDIDEDWGEAHIRRHLIKRVSIACAVMNMPLPRTIQYRRSASGHGWHARVPLYGRFWKQQLLLWRQIAGDDPMRVPLPVPPHRLFSVSVCLRVSASNPTILCNRA